jgi:non-heme chloroperoxidase
MHVEKSLELPTGVCLRYVEQGEKRGVPMILLHGYTDSWRSFEHVLPHLPPNIHAFAVTQRGHGDSDRPESGYRTRDFAADIAAFVRALRLGACIIVGHSMGTTNALRFAIDYPKLTRGLVLAATFAQYSRKPLIAGLGSAVSALEDPIDEAFVREFQQGTLANPVPESLLDTAVSESLKVPARVWRAVYEGFVEDDFTTEMRSIQAPTLVLWGDRDVLCPKADQEAVVRAIPDSRLVVYEGVGHALHWEEPKRFADHLAIFCTEISAYAPPRRRSATRQTRTA